MTALIFVAGSAGLAAANTILAGKFDHTDIEFRWQRNPDGCRVLAPRPTFLDFNALQQQPEHRLAHVVQCLLAESINETITGLTISYTNPQEPSGSTPARGLRIRGTAMFLVSGTARTPRNPATPDGMLYSIGDSGVRSDYNFDTF